MALCPYSFSLDALEVSSPSCTIPCPKFVSGASKGHNYLVSKSRHTALQIIWKFWNFYNFQWDLWWVHFCKAKIIIIFRISCRYVLRTATKLIFLGSHGGLHFTEYSKLKPQTFSGELWGALVAQANASGAPVGSRITCHNNIRCGSRRWSAVYHRTK